MRRDGKVAIVTGASSGIGLASAKALRQAGFRVFGTSRGPSRVSRDGITMVPCDVTDDASVKAAVDKVLDMAGKIDVLVNNAEPACLAELKHFGETGPGVVRRKPFRSDPHDQRGSPDDATTKGGTDHQYKFGPGVYTCSILRPLLLHEACSRRLFGVPGS